MLNGNRQVSSSFKKVLIAATAVAAVAMGSGQASAATFPVFNVNPTVFGTASGDLPADRISGSYYENFVVTGPGTFSSSGFSRFDAIKDASDASYLPGVSGLGVSYILYAEFTATGTFFIDGTGVVHFTATPGSGSAQLYVDDNLNDVYHTDKLDPLYGTVTGKGADDQKMVDGPLSSGDGKADSAAGASGDFSLTFAPISLTNTGVPCSPVSAGVGPGCTFFTQPRPFFYLNANLTGQFIDFSLVGPQRLTGDDSLTFSGAAVPEPATLTMLGLGLVGLARRRYGKKVA